MRQDDEAGGLDREGTQSRHTNGAFLSFPGTVAQAGETGHSPQPIVLLLLPVFLAPRIPFPSSRLHAAPVT